jgi:hypothetical protein
VGIGGPAFSGRLESEGTSARDRLAATTTAGIKDDLAILAHPNQFFHSDS